MGEADRAFEQDIAPFRPELLAHGYRMTGALSDAEAALREAVARAGSGDGGGERSTPRTRLYGIVTRACLDQLAARGARSLPELVHPPGVTTAQDDPPWLEPFPDALLGNRPDVASRASVRLAFVVALQGLPARERAALILRDVVGLSAEETAEALATSATVVDGALERARAALAGRARPQLPDDADVNVILTRYVSAWEAADTGTLIALLRDDAILSMPPMPLWIEGASAIVEFLTIRVFSHGKTRLVPTWANGNPAFGVYEHGELGALSVIGFDGDRIATLHAFQLDHATGARAFEPARFGLAPSL